MTNLFSLDIILLFFVNMYPNKVNIITRREVEFNFSSNDIVWVGHMLDSSSDLNKIFGLYNQNEVVIYI